MNRCPEPLLTSVQSLFERHGLGSLSPDQIVWCNRGRHDTMLIHRGEGACFLKRCGAPLISGPVSLAREAAFHSLVHDGRLSSNVTPYLGALVLSDEAAGFLIFDGYQEYLNLHDSFHAIADGVEHICSTIGRVLAVLHEFPEHLHAGLEPAANPVQTYGRCTPEMLAHSPRAAPELLRLLQSDPRLNESLRELRASWRNSALIHGDMKTDNILIPTAASGNGAEPRIVDWELAGTGDPAWDCGSFVGSLCFLWLESMLPGIGASDHVKCTARTLGSIRAFWTAYEAARTEDAAFGADEIDRAFRWAGYWLLQRVSILLPLRRSLTALDVSAGHVASHLLKDGASAGVFAGQH